MRFQDFDARGYRTVDVRTGYGEWYPGYEQTVEDAMSGSDLAEMRERLRNQPVSAAFVGRKT